MRTTIVCLILIAATTAHAQLRIRVITPDNVAGTVTIDNTNVIARLTAFVANEQGDTTADKMARALARTIRQQEREARVTLEKLRARDEYNARINAAAAEE